MEILSTDHQPTPKPDDLGPENPPVGGSKQNAAETPSLPPEQPPAKRYRPGPKSAKAREAERAKRAENVGPKELSGFIFVPNIARFQSHLHLSI